MIFPVSPQVSEIWQSTWAPRPTPAWTGPMTRSRGVSSITEGWPRGRMGARRLSAREVSPEQGSQGGPGAWGTGLSSLFIHSPPTYFQAAPRL